MSLQTLSQKTSAMKSTTPSAEEIPAEIDEPDECEQVTPRQQNTNSLRDFSRSAAPLCTRKLSLLTKAIQDNGNGEDERPQSSGRIDIKPKYPTSSIGSISSAAELTSDCGHTSSGTRDNSPSPPLTPETFRGLPPAFNKVSFTRPVSIKHDDEPIGPLQDAPKEQSLETCLSRRRCISFACGKKDEAKVPLTAEKIEPAIDPAPKRACSIRFACPSKVNMEKLTSPKASRSSRRMASPAPVAAWVQDQTTPRPHRDSDATIRDGSPKSLKKVPSIYRRSKKTNDSCDYDRSEATRFHEFASSEEEVDEWIHESTCHRSRLTVNDTLKIERNLQQIGQEAEDEAIEEEEEEDEADLEDEDDDEEDSDDDEEEEEIDEDDSNEADVDEDEEDASEDVETNIKNLSLFNSKADDGWSTDDEEGFAGSEDDSDGDSDYQWWAPGKSTAATSIDRLEHIRPTGQRTMSDSSVSSLEESHHSQRITPPKRLQRKSKPLDIVSQDSQLPDSTDFVCGTLDEDRPLEDQYLSCLERRRAAKHKAKPQDIDPTFPTSDPEMDDEEDEEEKLSASRISESDHNFMIYGSPEALDAADCRGRPPPKKKSPIPSPRRMRSPAPRRLFGQQSPRRLRSPPPACRLRSPPPTRRASMIRSPTAPVFPTYVAGLAERPQLTFATSLPRTTTKLVPDDGSTDEEYETPNEMPSRSAIDIKEGLERKRQRRREKLYQKYCKKAERIKDKRPQPGKGCERMREIGEELAAYNRGRQPNNLAAFNATVAPSASGKDMLMLSF